MAHGTDRANSVTVLVPPCRFDPLSGVVPHAAASGGRVCRGLIRRLVEPPQRRLHAHRSFDVVDGASAN